MNTHKGARLYPQDVGATHTLARFGFLRAEQLNRFHYPDYSPRSAANRFARLTQDGFWSRTPTYPRTSPHTIGRPTYIYYWTPANQAKLQSYLASAGHASAWDQSFATLTPLNNHEEVFSQLYLEHETDIVEYFLCLEEDARRHGWEVIFCERTSPFSKALREASGLPYGKLTITVSTRTRDGLETREEQMAFNPDGFYCLRSPDHQYHFFFHEEDNNTSTPLKFRRKLIAYKAFDEQGYWQRCLASYIKRYQLPIRGHLGFRVTTATPDPTRRDTLFLDSLTLKGYKRFLFASMTDIHPDTALSAIWLRGKEYEPVKAQLDALPPETAPAVYTRILFELLADMPRVSLKD